MPRILEVSRTPLFKHCFPAETQWVRMGAALTAGNEHCVAEQINARTLLRLWLEVRRGAFDLIILPSVETAYNWDPVRLKRAFRKVIAWAAGGAWSPKAVALLLRLERTPTVFIDFADSPQLSYDVCRLAPAFVCYFKREFVPDVTLSEEPSNAAINRKVAPSSLFLPTTDLKLGPTPKKTDLFFAGHLNNAVRAEGIRHLPALKERGFTIDLPTERLSYAEYMQRMSEAWLVWSPEGYGWDCYRHYEACFVGSVPLINYPALPRQLHLEGGAHCFYYDVAGDGLSNAVEEALGDKARLRVMSEAGRKHVLANFTREAMVARMQREIDSRRRNAGVESAPMRD